MVRKCREAEALKISEDMLKAKCKDMKADLEERSLELLKVKTELKRLTKAKEKLDAQNHKPLRENEKMSMEMLKEDVDDDFLKVSHRFSFRCDFVALKLFVLGLSLSQVEKVLKEMFHE